MKRETIQWHLEHYPLTQPQDAVKLAYQSRFGCGHMLTADCEARLANELSQTEADESASASESIGGGYCRLNLRSPLLRKLGAPTLARVMLHTADKPRGTIAELEDDLALLRTLARDKQAPFTLEALDKYLAAYRAAGYPMVSHSAAYRAAYAPAYRVALRGYADLLPLIAAVGDDRALVVLDGDSASGKSTAAGLLAALWDAQVFHMDDFFLKPAMRTEERLRQPGGNVDYERFEREVLQGLLTGKPFRHGRYSCQTGETEPFTAMPSRMTIIEGSYAMHPAFAEAYARLKPITVMLTVEPREQLARIRRRNGDTLAQRFEREWIPLEKQYFQAFAVETRAAFRLRLEEDEP